MRQVGDMKLYDFEEILEDTFGAVGTPERGEFENKVDEQSTQTASVRLSGKPDSNRTSPKNN